METGQSAHTTAVWPWISTVARLGLAAVWLVAGGLKVGDLAESGRAVNAYEIFPYDVAKVIGAAQPFLEIALGLLLLVGLAVRLSAAISAGLLLIFIAGITYAWVQGLQIDCGCFSSGGALGAGESPEYTLDIVRDVGFLLLAGILLWKPRTRFSIDGVLMGEE
ncbi:MauE/DoxX family redox-associated membrane protein [Actinoplanes friuliensis]|uniref:DoxX family protein n=1 Tax=Actinoplanes friuliensis DSM 7358 TaxID=1246995 RepID=U5VS23_9ACTN|nr:MauE/DoxX family redox-associated membrane protein [Actinoplanes friuliensis]AGZ39587.1 DoxX family protein [Actinoplanes friuliensis DSM 7358]